MPVDRKEVFVRSLKKAVTALDEVEENLLSITEEEYEKAMTTAYRADSLAEAIKSSIELVNTDRVDWMDDYLEIYRVCCEASSKALDAAESAHTAWKKIRTI